MRLALLALVLAACAPHARGIDHPLAEPEALSTLREASGLVRRGAYATAERVLRDLLEGGAEADAAEVFDRALALLQGGQREPAAALLAEVVTRWPNTSAAAYAADLRAELALVGAPAASLDAVRWLQGRATYADAPVTLLVFWETWCPYCRDSVPKLQPLLEARGAEGLQVVGLVKLSRATGDADVAAFVAEHGLTFPMGQEDGTLSEAFSVRGVPAMALVKDGVVAWRGHPMMLDEATLDRLLANGGPAE